MEEKKYCYQYPHPAVASDCVVFGFDGNDLKILLIQRNNDPHKGKWAFPGGFMEIDETADQGALRELEEETGLVLKHVKQVYTSSTVDRDPRERILSVVYYTLSRVAEVTGTDDAANAQWFSLNAIPPLAFDHAMLMKKALKKLRDDIREEPFGYDIFDQDITVPELKKLHRLIYESYYL